MRLIDAEAFLKTEIDRCGSVPLVGTCTSDNQYLSDRLKKAPTIEAKPVVHAHWEYHGGDDDMELYGFCSYCGKGRLTEDDILRLKPLLCPYCGAQMDEKENDK